MLLILLKMYDYDHIFLIHWYDCRHDLNKEQTVRRKKNTFIQNKHMHQSFINTKI